MLKKFIVLFFLITNLVMTAFSLLWAKEKSDKLYQELDLFSKVLSLIQEEYVENPDQKEIVYGAIRGMLSSLDPHSLFLSPSVYKELKMDTEGRFSGVGLEVTIKDNFLTVVTALEGTPAHKASIKENDRIVKINGISTKDINLSDAVDKMRGPRGSKVHLTLVREGSREPFDVTLLRDTIRIQSIRTELLEEKFGLLRITSFQEDAAKNLRNALLALEKRAPNKLKGIILDLRNNPGGLLDEAVQIADLFLEEGTIVSTSSRNKEIDKRVAGKSGMEPHYPIMVLINGGSASAAEIVAGALQDHKKAVLLGTQTFGKGSVQTIFELGDGAALKLTVAKYYTPNGRSIQAEGVKPDVIVEAQKPSSETSRDRLLREKDLKGHLEEEHPSSKTTSSSSLGEDYQKQVALDYLKSWDVFNKGGGRP